MPPLFLELTVTRRTHLASLEAILRNADGLLRSFVCILRRVSKRLHRPAIPPAIDVGAHETVILDGCVVSPSAFSEERDQFVLELAAESAGAREPDDSRRMRSHRICATGNL